MTKLKFINSEQNRNSFFMVIEKLVLTILNFTVFATVARFMGAESIGLFSLVQVILLIGWPIALFVNEQAMIRYVLDQNTDTNSIFKHACILKLLSSATVYLLSILLTYLFYDATIAFYASIFCLIHFFNYDLIFLSYFRAHHKSNVIFNLKIPIALIFSVIKISAVLITGELVYLFTLYAFEFLILGICAFFCYFNSDNNKALLTAKIEKGRFFQLIKSSVPLFGSAVVITLYSRIDQLMINSFLGSAALGQYAVGVKLSESSTMLLGAFFASRFPALLRSKEQGIGKYNEQIVLQLQLSLVIGSSLLITMMFFSTFVISLLFGDQYVSAAPVLVIHMVGGIFVYYGMICTQWLIAEQLEIYRFYRVLTGLLLNIILNILWIKEYGIIGAAYATAISQVGSNVIFNAISHKTLPFFKLQLESFSYLTLLKNTKKLLS